MGRRLIPPPLGLPERRNLVTCEERKAELLAEFLQRLDYVKASFGLGLRAVDFNASLSRLKRAIKTGRQGPGRGERIHPFLEMLINSRARQVAAKRTGDATITAVVQEDVEKAAAWVVANISQVRGRPRAELLYHHVGGLMALIMQFTGSPVIARRHAGTARYEPTLLGPARILLHLREIDPTVTETQLVNTVCKLRRDYSDKPMRFRDFYPLYGASLGRDGVPALATPLRLEHFERCYPIYCP